MAFATTYSPPGTLVDQRFTKTCLGTEGDTFPILLPATRLDANYIAVVTLLFSANESQYICNAPPSGYTTTQITCITGNPPVAGDILSIVVTEKT